MLINVFLINMCKIHSKLVVILILFLSKIRIENENSVFKFML